MDYFCKKDNSRLIFADWANEFSCRRCGNTEQPCDECNEMHDKSEMTCIGKDWRKVQTGEKNWPEDDGLYWREVNIYVCNSCTSEKEKSTKKGRRR